MPSLTTHTHTHTHKHHHHHTHPSKNKETHSLNRVPTHQVKDLRQPVSDMKGDAEHTASAVKQLAEQNNKVLTMEKEQARESRANDQKLIDAKRAADAAAQAATEAAAAAVKAKKTTSVSYTREREMRWLFGVFLTSFACVDFRFWRFLNLVYCLVC